MSWSPDVERQRPSPAPSVTLGPRRESKRCSMKTSNQIGHNQRSILDVVASGAGGRIPVVKPDGKGKGRPSIPARVAGPLVARGMLVKVTGPHGPLRAPIGWWRITARGLDALDGLENAPRGPGRPPLKRRARLVSAFARGALPEQRAAGARAPRHRWCRPCLRSGKDLETGLRCQQCGGRGRYAARCDSPTTPVTATV
jgi:hypothetical protein